MLCNIVCTMISPRLGEMSEPIRLNSLLLPKFDGWAIILPLCSTVCPSCASAPFAAFLQSMTIPQISSIVIRPARAGDAEAIARVRVDSWRETYRGMIPDTYLDGMKLEDSTAIWTRILGADSNAICVFVAHEAVATVAMTTTAAMRTRRNSSNPTERKRAS